MSTATTKRKALDQGPVAHRMAPGITDQMATRNRTTAMPSASRHLSGVTVGLIIRVTSLALCWPTLSWRLFGYADVETSSAL